MPDSLERTGARRRACALPFRAGRGRPRPGCRLLLGAADPRQLTDGITPSDREVLGERAPTRRSVPLTAACRSSAMAHRLVDLYSGGRRGVRAYRSQQAPVRRRVPRGVGLDRRLRIALARSAVTASYSARSVPAPGSGRRSRRARWPHVADREQRSTPRASAAVGTTGAGTTPMALAKAVRPTGLLRFPGECR